MARVCKSFHRTKYLHYHEEKQTLSPLTNTIHSNQVWTDKAPNQSAPLWADPHQLRTQFKVKQPQIQRVLWIMILRIKPISSLPMINSFADYLSITNQHVYYTKY